MGKKIQEIPPEVRVKMILDTLFQTNFGRF